MWGIMSFCWLLFFRLLLFVMIWDRNLAFCLVILYLTDFVCWKHWLLCWAFLFGVRDWLFRWLIFLVVISFSGFRILFVLLLTFIIISLINYHHQFNILILLIRFTKRSEYVWIEYLLGDSSNISLVKYHEFPST